MYNIKRKHGNHSMRLTNEIEFKYPLSLNPLGRIVWIGFKGSDFHDGKQTLMQFVKMPRIFIKK